MTFCTVINCMDGRTQVPVIRYLQRRFSVDYVDSITEAGPNLVLAEAKESALIDMMIKKIRLSIERHHSVGLAVVGHYDCAGNPAPETVQTNHLQKAVEYLHRRFDLEVIGLWVDEKLKVREVVGSRGASI